MMIRRTNGFTLIEVAIVMLILAVLISAAILPLRGQRQTANINTARDDIEAIEEALYGFAIANGRLPCPTQPGVGGVEQPAGGICVNGSIGFVPSTTLGLKGDVNCDGLLVDPWGRPYLYSVTTVLAGNNTYTRSGVGSIQDVTITALAGQPALRICTDSACGTNLTDEAVAVIISTGENTAASADQLQNAGEAAIASGCTTNYGVSADNDYVYHTAVEEAGNEFDDIVSWISPNILFAKMLAAGRLP